MPKDGSCNVVKERDERYMMNAKYWLRGAFWQQNDRYNSITWWILMIINGLGWNEHKFFNTLHKSIWYSTCKNLMSPTKLNHYTGKGALHLTLRNRNMSLAMLFGTYDKLCLIVILNKTKNPFITQIKRKELQYHSFAILY